MSVGANTTARLEADILFSALSCSTLWNGKSDMYINAVQQRGLGNHNHTNYIGHYVPGHINWISQPK